MNPELENLVKRAADILKKAGATEVFVFGSATTGQMRSDSDIDLAVSGLPPELFFDSMAKTHAVLNRSLDLVDLDEQTPFTRYLKSKGRLLRVA